MRYKSTKQYQSRLARQESKRIKRQTIFLIVITIAIALSSIFIGIPLLIKMAIFISDWGNQTSSTLSSDTIPPQTPQLSSPPEATNSASLNLNGVSEAGSTVTLFQNNQERIKTLVDAKGFFSFTDIELEPGTNSFYTTAKDSAGNESNRSTIRSVNFDITPPTLGITSPEDGEYISGATKQLVSVNGVTEIGARVTLNGRLLVVKSDGSFTGQFPLVEGDNKLEFVASDVAGNNSNVSISLTYSRE